MKTIILTSAAPRGDSAAVPRPSKGQRHALATGLAALLVALAPQLSRAECKIQSMEMPVEIIGSRAVAKVGIQGQTLPLVLDTGAFHSTLNADLAQQLGLELRALPRGMRIMGITGEAEAKLTTVKRLQLRGGDLPDMDFVVGGHVPAQGVGLMGRNILGATDAEYDLGSGEMRLLVPNSDCRDGNMAYWAEGQPVSELALLPPDRASKTPALQVVVEVNGVRMTALLDTGAQTMLLRHAAERAGITGLKPLGQIRGFGQGTAPVYLGGVNRVVIGKEQVTDLDLPVVEAQLGNVDMLLGMDFFQSHRLYVSKRQRRLYFTYNGGPMFTLAAQLKARAAAPASAASGTH